MALNINEKIKNTFIKNSYSTSTTDGYSANYVNETLNNYFATQNYTSSSESINADSYKTYTIDVTKSDYTPIGIVMVDSNNSANVSIAKYSLFGTAAYITLRNLSSSQITGITCTIKVLYIKA